MDLSPLLLLLLIKPLALNVYSDECSEVLAGNSFDERTVVLRDGRSLQISRVHVDDASNVISFVRRTGDETDNLTFSGDEIDQTADDQIRQIRFLNRSGSLVIKGVVDNSLVALVSIRRAVGRSQLNHVGKLSIMVSRSHWRLGIANHLMRASLAWARAAGLHKIELEVIEDNYPAIQLYTSHGFVTEGVSKDAVRVKGRYKDFVLMALILE